MMAGRHCLRHGQPRVLERHDGPAGRDFRSAWVALTAEFGAPPSVSLIRAEMTRTALAWTRYLAAQRSWATAQHARATGTGRRPSAGEVARLSKRAALEEQSYAAAVDRLRDLAGRRGGVPAAADDWAKLRAVPPAAEGA